jgi:hypothetical protein
MDGTEVYYIYVGHADKPHGPWKIIPDTPEERQKAIDEGYTAGSITSFTFGENGKLSRWTPMRGSLFIEFEAVREPAIAMSRAREFIIKRLVDDCAVDPGCLRYWMNGSRGCHIEIPAAIYGGERGRRGLPSIHFEMLWPLGLYKYCDTKVHYFVNYSQHCVLETLVQWPNIKRPNGRYKVPVSAEEFFNLDYSDLERLTFAPRTDFDPGTKQPILSPRLAQLFNIVAGWRRKSSKGGVSFSCYMALSSCSFIIHCIRHQATLSESYWKAMVSILSTISTCSDPLAIGSDLGRNTIHFFGRDYPGYNYEETEKMIEQQKINHEHVTCEYIKFLGFDCGKACGVCRPVDRLNW